MSGERGRRDAANPLAAGKGDRQFVTALARGLEVLRCFTPQRRTLGTSQIAALTGLPQPTVWRLCHTLRVMGYLTQDPGSDKFTPGVPVLALGFAVMASLDVLEVVRPAMQRVADHFGAAVALSERDRMSMVYLDRCHGRAVFLFDLRAGARLPIHNSAAGWGYIAAADEDERAELMAEIRRRSGRDWPVVRDRIEASNRKYEVDRFVANYSLQHQDVTAVAVPIRVGGRVVVVNCTGLRTALVPEIMEREVAPALRELAGTIAAAMSAGAPPSARPTSPRRSSR